MKTQVMTWTLMLAAFIGGAAAQQNPVEPANTAGMMSMMKDCPMSVQGAEIAVADTADGIALTITTKTGNVNELRERVQRMLAMHGLPAKLATIDTGATVNLTPKHPAQLTAFRKQVREHVEHMSKDGACQQMHQMMDGMTKGIMGGMGDKKSAPDPKPEIKKEESEIDHKAHHPPEEKR